MINAIELVHVSKLFGERTTLDKLSFSVPQGAIFGLLGPNGAGKTTTIRTLLGLIKHDHGTVRVLGLDPLFQSDAIRAGTGVLLESDGLYGGLSAFDNLDFHARIHRIPASIRRERIEEMLRMCGLSSRRRDATRRLSRGMRQRLALARSLLHRPRLLLLDEPFAGLDPVAAVDLRETLARLVDTTEMTVLIASHDLAHVEKVCTQVAVISAGHVLASGAPGSLGSGKGDVEVEIIGKGLSADILSVLANELPLASYALDGDVARVTCSAEAHVQLASRLSQHGVLIQELRTRGNTLEDVFLSLVGGQREEG